MIRIPRGRFPKGGRPRTQPVLDHVLQMSVDKTAGKYDDETGRYGEVVLTGLRSKDHAREVVRSMYRSARYMKVSLHQSIERTETDHQIRFTVINKAHAREYVNKIAPEKRAYNQHIPVVGEI